MKLPIPKPGGYMIYDTLTEEFAKKGIGNFSKRGGKIWANIGHLKNHLLQYAWHDYRNKQYVVLYAKKLQRCIVYDVVTQEPLPDFDIVEYIKNHFTKEDERYSRGWPIVLSERE